MFAFHAVTAWRNNLIIYIYYLAHIIAMRSAVTIMVMS